MKRLPTLAQHFLRSPITVRRLIGHTNIKKTDVVFDIGAGSGVVSSALAGSAKAVVAVEVDARLVPTLRENLKRFHNVQVRHANILTMELPKTPYKIFANIPFNLSAQIVQRLTLASTPPTAMYIIVQEQFARRLLPDKPGYSSQLGMVLGVGFAVRIRYRLQPGDFYPRPNVPTVLFEILPRPTPLVGRAAGTVRAIYYALFYPSPKVLGASAGKVWFKPKSIAIRANIGAVGAVV